jgi:type I restriction enzyme S subunit
MKQLKKDMWKQVFYGDYVDHIEVNETNTEKRKNARYVSVEHIETGKLKIESWVNEEMPTFFRTFKPGQILFGKRRAYQRKFPSPHSKSKSK